MKEVLLRTSSHVHAHQLHINGLRQHAEPTAISTLQPLSTHVQRNIMADEMTDLEAVTGTLVAVFHKYSGKEGNKYTLSKSELKDLLKNEFCMDHAHDPKAVEKIITCLDADKSGEVDFKEYCSFVACMAMCQNKFFEDEEKAKGKK